MPISHAQRSDVVDLVPSPRGAAPVERSSVGVSSARLRASEWIRRNLAALLFVETAAAGVAGASSFFVGAQATGTVPFWTGLGLAVAWPALLGMTGAYSARYFGTGPEEYRRVFRAGLLALALAGFGSYAAGLELSRGLVVVAMPALTLVTLLGRFAVRRRLHWLWSQGRCTRRVVLAGRGGAVLELAARLERAPFGGLEVVAVCVTEEDRGRVGRARELPVGGLDDVLSMAMSHGADTIAVTSASETAAEYLRGLSWQLEGTDLELLVAPGLVEVAGPRLHIRPFEGLPLLSVEQPRFEGWQRIVKGAVDRGLAALAVVILAPLLVAIGVAVSLSGPGPVLYRQQRVGVNGRSFTMLKFRSMVIDADRRLEEIRADNISDGLLFKMREDPRVTPIGRWLRRLSLDELPQLFNVLGGTMSLVGPRPPLPGEVARYDSSVSRRLLVKPGLTGLWQVSGRSDLPWEEAVWLDLRYVENWSLAVDAKILWKTFSAVVRAQGAY